MGLNTDLHTAPYFNDYDENKNYHMMVFKPSFPVQARELTQLQTILQNQIERFGDNILVRGTVVKGGNFFDYRTLPYVKIEDNTVKGDPVNLSNYKDVRLRGVNSDVTAMVLTTLEGNTNTSPNLNTLYVKYIKTGTDGSGNDLKTFSPGETLEVTIGGVIQSDYNVSVASLSIDKSPIGNGYGVSCGDGVIYQKGFFIRFENQIAIIDRYNTMPDGIVVGFVTDESIVTAEDDHTLYNNAQGFYNENTPGADRIKLTPRLIFYKKSEAEDDENFLALQEYQEGRLVRRNVKTNFNSISKELEKRTFEESGDYVVTGMNVFVSNPPNSTIDLDLNISAGVAYVNGKRSQTIGKYTIDLPKSNTFDSVMSQDVLANYGNFIYVDDIIGAFPFESMGVVQLRSLPQSATSLVGYSPLGVLLGNARVLSYDKESDGRYRVYLFDIKMNSGQTFINTKSISVFNGTGFANLILESGKAVLKDTGFKSLVFPLGHSSVKEIITTDTDYVYRKSSTMSVGLTGSMILSSGSDETFPYTASANLNSDSRRDLIVTNSTTGIVYPVTSATIDATGTVMTVELGTLGNATDVIVTYNVKRNNVRPTGKVLRTVYMRIDCTGGLGVSDGTLYLGWPDVVSIEGIWRGTNNTFTENTAGVVDVKQNFTLNKNINDMYYGISFLKKKGAYTIAPTHRYLVKAKVFVKDVSGSFSQSFYCVNSYPVDDTSEVLPANKIRTEEIPNGMRDVIDFRPYARNNAAYAALPENASIATISTPFSGLNFNPNSFLIAPNRNVETSYSYYLGRRDILIVNDTGEFELIVGEPSTNPTYPPQPPKTMAISKIYVPPFPSLTPPTASRSGYPEYGVKVYKENNRRYTMEEIIKLEERLDNIEYYTILNALEKSAEDMVITDSDGLNRFKNGIFVDNFDNMLACEVKNPDFSASVDAGESTLYPRFRSYNLDLREPFNVSNVTFNNDTVATINYKHVVMEEQKFATKFRNCVTDFYNFAGVGSIYPEYDNGYDETRAPDVTVNVDMVGAFAEYTSALSELVPLTVKDVNKTTTNKNLGTSTSTSTDVLGRTTSTQTTSTLTTSKTVTDTSKLVTKKPTTTTQKVGDFVTNVTISPYLRANVLRMYFTGLRPNTRFWVWFDGKNVTNRCAMAKTRPGSNELKHLVLANKWGTIIRSDANGELLFMFNMPGETYYVGDRELMVMDVDSLDSEEAATSAGVVTYSGFNYNVEKTGLEVSTRTPNYDIKKSTSVLIDKKIVTSQSSTTVSNTPFAPGFRTQFGRDPIAQTFFVDPSYSNTDSVMITKVGVSFKKKSPNLGVTLQIRKTVNGYPSDDVLAFGSVRKKSSEVVVSDNGSAVTTFIFKSPITLATGESYAIVVIPDGNSPDYQIFCAQTGQSDLRTGTKITSDVNSGTLFTSTNNMAWTPYQAENMKFIIHKAQYIANKGSLFLTLNNYEFLEVDGISGKFKRGETAFTVRANAAGSISTTTGSSTITGVGTTFTSTFAVGDYIAIYDSVNLNYDVAKINNITNNTTMTVDEIMTDNRTGRTYFKTVVGIVDYFNNVSPARLILKESSSKTGNVFVAGTEIRGEISNSSALINVVGNLPISHYQANIMRTNFNNTYTNLILEKQANRHIDSGVSLIMSPNLNQVFGDNNRLTNYNTELKSRSNEIVENSSNRTFRLKMDIGMNGNGPHYVSPSVDYDISSITVFEYLINPATAENIETELSDGGECLSKSISKKITLRDGFDAEDLKVWITAYRPPRSEINVYVKFISDIDSTPLTEMPWTRMVLADRANFRSSSTNLEDFKEFEFSMPVFPKAAGKGAWVENGEFKYIDIDGAEYTNFKHFIIKITFNSGGQNIIPKVRDIRAIALT